MRELFARRNEVRLGTLLIGAIQVLWSVLPAIGADFRLRRVLDYFHHSEDWLVIMAALGLLLIAGSCLRWRAGRQIGLVLSCGMWASYFGLWVRYVIEHDRLMVSAVFITAPILSIFCLLLFANDVMQKPREDRSSDDGS